MHTLSHGADTLPPAECCSELLFDPLGGRPANCFSIHHETHAAVEAMYKAARDAGGMPRMRPRGRRGRRGPTALKRQATTQGAEVGGKGGHQKMLEPGRDHGIGLVSMCAL